MAKDAENACESLNWQMLVIGTTAIIDTYLKDGLNYGSQAGCRLFFWNFRFQAWGNGLQAFHY